MFMHVYPCMCLCVYCLLYNFVLTYVICDALYIWGQIKFILYSIILYISVLVYAINTCKQLRVSVCYD